MNERVWTAVSTNGTLGGSEAEKLAARDAVAAAELGNDAMRLLVRRFLARKSPPPASGQ